MGNIPPGEWQRAFGGLESGPPRGHDRAVRSVLAPVLLVSACSQAPERALGRMPYEPAVDAGMPDAAMVGSFDFRLPLVEPGFVGTSQRCDVVAVGEQEQVTHRNRAAAYGEVVERVTVTCATGIGTSRIDLIIPAPARPLVRDVVPGRRIAVTIRSSAEGHEDLPVAELTAVVPITSAFAVPPEDTSTVAAGDDVSARRVRRGRARCGVAWVGSVRTVPRELTARFPSGASHYVTLACRHPTGEALVDLVATRRAAPALLGIRRGDVVTLRILAPRGGAADLPIASLVAVRRG